ERVRRAMNQPPVNNRPLNAQHTSTGAFDWRGKRVLVTGAGGFIGSHLTERLVELGADVTAFLRYSSSGTRGLLEMLPLPAQQKVHCLFGDLCDPTSLERMG